MSATLGPRVVLVTGCSTGGIGFALCEEFARQGCKVYATSRKLETMQGFSDPNIELRALDVTSDEDVRNVISEILEINGRIDVLVNNAGAICAGPLIDQSLDVVKRMFDTNTLAALRTAKAVIPAMAKRRSGVIVNIGSIVGETATPWNGVYSATKAALQSISDVLSMECKPFNVFVLHVSAGSVKSNIANNQASHFALPPDTLYASFLPDIMRRIYSSQNRGPMAANVFAQRVVSKALSKSPPIYMTLGGNSPTFTLFKWLPKSWSLSILWRLYSKTLRGG